MVLAVILTLYFLSLTVLEILHGSLMNAFVLGTATAACLKGLVVKKNSYLIVACLVASAFSVLMILAYLASGEFSFGVLGIVVVPYVVWKFLKTRAVFNP